MDSFSAMMMGEANRDKEQKVFNWDKAARLIKESGAKTASAGLQSDWEYTGGEIFTDGKPNYDDYTYLASTWATPEIEIDGRVQACYKRKSKTPGWEADMKWPESALKILNGE